jgi:hypothetical protein
MSLVVLFVVAMIGLGATFLTDMNLKIAENGRTNAIARYNAEAGLDTALVVLAKAYRDQEGHFPATKAELEAILPETNLYQLHAYELFSSDEGRVSVRGVLPNRNAEHLVEARFRGVAGPTELVTQTVTEMNPLFGVGFVANGTITFPGNSTLDLNVWSGNEIWFPGGRSHLGAGFWARAAGGGDCRIGRLRCQNDAESPNVTGPSFAALRTQIIEHAMERAGVSTMSALCSTNVAGSQSLNNQTNRVICLNSGATLTLTGTVSNLVVIGDHTTTVRLSANTVPGGDEGLGVTIVSRTVDLTDRNTTMQGQNTVVAMHDIEFNKGVTSVDNTARTLIATEGSILLNGNGGRDIYATFWAGGSFRINGTIGNFIGSVVADTEAQAITGNGGVSYARLPERIINPFIPTITITESAGVSYEDAGIRVLSRR